MRIAGFQKQSLIDYPGNISSVIFTQGCNFRCGFCHNPNLVLPEHFEQVYNNNTIYNYLYKYKNLLSAVVITGGEPTIHNDLPDFIERIKSLDLKVKLDSNGTHPLMLKKLISNKLIDYIAMDIKHILSYQNYNSTVGHVLQKDTFYKILDSIEIIITSGIDHEFRTTIVKGLHSVDEIKSLKKHFTKGYKLQNYKPSVIIDPNSEFSSFSQDEFESLKS